MNDHRTQYLFLIILFLLPSWCCAQSISENTLQIIESDQEFKLGKYSLAPYLYLVYDTTELWTVEDVQAGSFQSKFRPDTLQLLAEFGADMGPETKSIWARIRIHSMLDHPRYWLLNFSAGKVDMYVAGKSGRYMRTQSGIYLPMRDRSMEGSFGLLPALPILLPADSTMTIYFNIVSNGLFVKNGLFQEFHQSLFSPETLFDFDRKFRAFHFLIIGILLAVFFYHLVIFFFNRRPVFLFFSLFVLGYTLLIALFSGYFAEFIIPQRDKTFGILFMGAAWIMVYIFFYLFSRVYLQVRELFPFWDKIWAGLVLIRILLIITKQTAVVSAGSLENTDKNTFFILLLLMEFIHLLFFSTAIYVAVRSYQKGNKPARIYLVAITAFIIQELLSSELQFFPMHDLPKYVDLGGIGIAMTVLLFSIGIASVIRSLEKEKMNAEQSQFRMRAEAIRMKEVDQFKTQFYTDITHEFRTPLTIILGMVEQIKNRPSTWLEEGLTMINRNARKLLNLINQMLDLSKLEAGSTPVSLVQDDIAMYLKYLVESFESLAASKGILFEYSVHPNVIKMDFDPDKMENILSNLLSNAIKFTRENGRIEVNVQEQKTEVEHNLLLSVKDTGPGIPAGEIPKIFDRHYQAATDDQPMEEGSGLGLAITREMIKLLKGSITVESKQGEGSTFTVRLPILNQGPEHQQFTARKTGISEHSMEESDSLMSGSADRMQLLIVEDNKDVVRYLRSILESEFEIEVAVNGKLGFEIAVENIPNLVISDVMMPVMDGFSFCEKLKADIRTSHIPVILLTARADAESKWKGLSAGADVYLAKPFDKTELLISIRKLTELRKKLLERYEKMSVFPTGSFESDIDTEYKKEDSFIQNVRQTLEDHISDEEYGITELCQSMAMSRTQLYRKFTGLTNTTLHHFIRNLRLARAKELLLSTELNVSEVALECGFRNLSHFSKTFSGHYGMAPSHARKK